MEWPRWEGTSGGGLVHLLAQVRSQPRLLLALRGMLLAHHFLLGKKTQRDHSF